MEVELSGTALIGVRGAKRSVFLGVKLPHGLRFFQSEGCDDSPPPPHSTGESMRSEKREMIERRKICRVAEQLGNVWWSGAMDEEMKRRMELQDKPRGGKHGSV